MSQFLSEANKLKNIQLYLEKNDNLLNFISKYGGELNLVDYFLSLEKERKSDVDKISQELRNIWQQLCLKKKLLREGNVNTLDLQRFKEEMIELQDSIITLKTRCSSNVQKLKDEEKIMQEMTEIFNQKLTEWEKIVKTPNSYTHVSSKNIRAHNDHYKEVLEFMEFVNKSTGHENGWSSEDHQLFLKLRRKYKNIDELAFNLNKLLPDIGTDNVKDHEIWFSKYTFLKNKKEEALKRWRRDKKENISQNSEETNIPPISCKINVDVKNEDIRTKIALWKAKKEAKRQEENTCEQMKLEKKKRLDADKRKFDYQVKNEVIKWKEAKVEKELNQKVQKELEEYYQKRIRAATANRLIRQFQTQDDLFIARMRLAKLKEENESRKRSKSSYLMDRDPERILKPTKQWLLRTTKENVDNQIFTYVPNVRQIPKLKIPDWRRNPAIQD